MVNSLSQLAAGAAFQGNNERGSRIAALMSAASSGNRIARAMDDIASLSAATSLSAEVSGLRGAAQNITQASSFLEVADGAIGEIGSILDRLKQLSVQANSGALDDNSRRALNTEFQGLLDEVDRLAGETNFNGVKLLDGSLSGDTSLRFEQTLEAGDVRISGVAGDSLLTQAQAQAASLQISFASAGDINAGDTISISDGAGGAVNFEFVNGAPAAANEIEIGATLEQTLENAALAINAFSGANDTGVSQLNARIDGNALVLENQTAGNVVGDDGSTVITAATTTAGTLSRPAFDNGAAGSIDVREVTASDFTGQISGFEAEFTGTNDRVNVSLKVGNDTFTARDVDTNSTADELVTFTSENGGSFSITLAGGQGESVRDASDAETFAARLDGAFEGVRFSQNREITSARASGDLAGATFELDGSAFDGIQYARAAVLNGRLEVTIGDVTYRSADLGDSVGAGERVSLIADNGRELTFTNGEKRFDISTQTGGAALASAVDDAFASAAGNIGGAAFQVSASSQGNIQIGVGDFTRAGLGLEGANLLSADSAGEAFNSVGAAIQTLTSQRADVGAFQQALDFAANNIASAIQNQEAARSVLSDADLAAVSTELSLLEVAAQAAINTQAQTNNLQTNLLKLVQ